ncbi:hypothetical protein C8F01DRAFT_1258323 [Mycena amicta]|nr:hypothetical protein C8F01DRAFT_1258323 [Mycena amicta]
MDLLATETRSEIVELLDRRTSLALSLVSHDLRVHCSHLAFREMTLHTNKPHIIDALPTMAHMAQYIRKLTLHLDIRLQPEQLRVIRAFPWQDLATVSILGGGPLCDEDELELQQLVHTMSPATLHLSRPPTMNILSMLVASALPNLRVLRLSNVAGLNPISPLPPTHVISDSIIALEIRRK